MIKHKEQIKVIKKVSEMRILNIFTMTTTKISYPRHF